MSRQRLAEWLDYLGEIGYGDLYLDHERGDPGRPAGERAPQSATSSPPASSAEQGSLFGESLKPANDYRLDLAPEERLEELRELEEKASRCHACPLCEGRQTVVFGSGDPNAELMFIGEGPGAQEDRQGLPFVGPAGELLTKIIRAIELERDQVYIANMVKCRPPNNRDPEPDELNACRPYLERQIDLVQPRVIVALGRVAAQALLETKAPLGRLRGRWYPLRGAEVRATYHPAALLRYTKFKRPTWEDMQVVRDRLRELQAS